MMLLPFFAEDNNEDMQNERISQVINNPDYLVTPGDKYLLSFILSSSGDPTTISFLIKADYTINLSFFGEVNVKGFSYHQLQKTVEDIIKAEYPKSYPQVIIEKPGEFSVYVQGEVNRCREVKAWGLTKLSEILDEVKTDYSSVRDIEVIHADGSSNSYDMYKAIYFGTKDQDPYLQRQDTIVFRKHSGQVSVEGAVFRPGSFEISEGDTLDVALSHLSNGLLPLADSDRIQVKRYLSKEHRYGETQYLTAADIENFELNDLDQIFIPEITDYQSTVYFQGALGSEDVSNKIPVKITAGDKLSFVTREVEEEFNRSSDLSNVLLVREGVGDPIEINLEELLTKEDSTQDIILEDGDTIIVPFRQYKVFVTGQVTNPGSYPYIANRTWEYYVGLAGGFDMQNHMGNKVKIRDVYGEKHDQDDRIIQPEDVLYAPINHPMYYVREYGGDVLTISSIIIGTATLIYTLDQIADGNPAAVLTD